MRSYVRAIGLLLIGCRAIAAAPPADRAPFQLKDGDRVALVGATLIERDRHYGHLETVLRIAKSWRYLGTEDLAPSLALLDRVKAMTWRLTHPR